LDLFCIGFVNCDLRPTKVKLYDNTLSVKRFIQMKLSKVKADKSDAKKIDFYGAITKSSPHSQMPHQNSLDLLPGTYLYFD
jgi:hypothetical protein